MEQLDDSDEIEEASILSRTGYLSQQEIKSDILKVTQSLRKAKGESNGNEENADASGADKYPLVSVPDEMLTPEQVCVLISCHLCLLCRQLWDAFNVPLGSSIHLAPLCCQHNLPM
jgi:hypothetical protein